jgi:hypothetical protein
LLFHEIKGEKMQMQQRALGCGRRPSYKPISKYVK